VISFEETIKELDHNHVTLEVRGWLCHKCNKGLGLFKDNPALLEKAQQWITKKLPPKGKV
jgi:hypothetical protein